MPIVLSVKSRTRMSSSEVMFLYCCRLFFSGENLMRQSS